DGGFSRAIEEISEVQFRGRLHVRHSMQPRCCASLVQQFFAMLKNEVPREDGARNDSETVDVTIASLDYPAPFAPRTVIWLEDKLARSNSTTRCHISRKARSDKSIRQIF